MKSPHHPQIITPPKPPQKRMYITCQTMLPTYGLVDKVLRIGQLANFGAFPLLPQQHGQRILKLAEFDVSSLGV